MLRRTFRLRCGKAKTFLLILLLSCVVHLILFVNYTIRVKKERLAAVRILLKSGIDNGSYFENVTRNALLAGISFSTRKDSGRSSTRDCSSPGLIQDGMPWPNCGAKMQWMKENWRKDKCYASNGVSDDPCSMMEYLSKLEHQCPPDPNVKPTLQPLYFNGEVAEPMSNFLHLYNDIDNVVDYSWIKDRIKRMENMWINSSSHLFTPDSPKRMRKRIHLHLGLMSLGMGEGAWTGGPLGELVQWSDLIAALFIMGHDIVITSKNSELNLVYGAYKGSWGNSGCPPSSSDNGKVPFDIVYTDIIGLKALRQAVRGNAFTPIECRVRVLDSFGTEASFNHPPYRNEKKLKAMQYNDVNINLQQFNTMFPHSPDNTFLGFVSELPQSHTVSTNATTKRDIALVYGKAENFWKGKEKYIDIIKEYVAEVHATVHEPKHLSSYIVNHGVINSETLSGLMQRTKIFVGLGFPFEGPAPLEAIQGGAVFLNPKFREPISSLNNEFYKKKPTRRKVTSQNPYAEKYIGKPYVYSVDIDDEIALRETLKEITAAPDPGEFLRYEFSVTGMLERLSIQVEKQQFCTYIPYSNSLFGYISSLKWPPFSALKVHVAKQRGGETCNDVCEGAGLICEPSFFPVLNREEGFKRAGLTCNEIKMPNVMDSDHPTYDNGTCYLQTNPKLFSCAENYLNFQRLCPCRDFLHTQVALCRQCSL